MLEFAHGARRDAVHTGLGIEQEGVTRALPLFDRIVIGVGVNERKQTRLSAQERREAIERLYADDPRVEDPEGCGPDAGKLMGWLRGHGEYA